MRALFKIFIVIILPIIAAAQVSAQSKTVRGFVYGSNYRTPIPDVEVFSSSGNKTQTDSIGAYKIAIKNKNDSIWFRFLGKNTVKFSADTITNANNFEVRIYLPDSYHLPHELPTVVVFSRTYYQDSVQLRKDYSTIFNDNTGWKAIGNSIGTTSNGGIGIGVDEIVNMFRFGYNRRMQVYQKFALMAEQDRYIDHRFTKELVESITGLYDKDRDDYMLKYRPNYTQLVLMDDNQLGKYIEDTYKKYMQEKQKSNISKKIIVEPNP